MFGELCDAVAYLHNLKPEPLAHRDLKTSNVCLDDGLSPVLMDLGSAAPAKVQVCGAQDAQRLQDVASEQCSMPYKAPELFNVESYCVVDERTDIWVMVPMMAFGEKWWQGRNVIDCFKLRSTTWTLIGTFAVWFSSGCLSRGV